MVDFIAEQFRYLGTEIENAEHRTLPCVGLGLKTPVCIIQFFFLTVIGGRYLLIYEKPGSLNLKIMEELVDYDL